jgi:ABC-type glycerol-3-phosphate transport system permease component
MLTIVFLRLYAFNLERSFRSSAHQACGDALAQMIMLLILPLWVVLGSMATFFRGSVLGVHLGNVSFILVTVAFLLPLNLWAMRQFSRYKNMPDAALCYCSTGERYKSAIALVLFLILLLVALISLHPAS